MSGSKLEIVRPCGPFEVWFAYRQYRRSLLGVGMLGRYTPAPTHTTLVQAIAAVALQQPMMRVGLTGDASATPAFTRLHEIDLSRIVSVHDVEASSGEEYDAGVMALMGRLQDKGFEDLETVPMWRVAVVRPAGAVAAEADAGFVDVVFIFHHSMGDGMSGVAFQESLRDILNGPQDAPLPQLDDNKILALPDAPPVVPELLNLIPFKLTLTYLFKEWWNEKMPPWVRIGPPEPPLWSITQVDPDLPYVTNLRLAIVPTEASQAAAAACKAHGVGMAALLNALLAVAAARHMPADEAAKPKWLRGMTTINLRPWVGDSKLPPGMTAKRIVFNAISTYGYNVSPNEIGEFRTVDFDSSNHATTPSSSSHLDDIVWRTAGAVMAAQRAKLASLPVDDFQSLLPWAGDLRGILRKRTTKGIDRILTYEVGSLGLVEPYVPVQGGAKRHELSRILFTNPALVEGAPLMLNVATVRGGDMALALSFGEKHVDPVYIEAVLADIRGWMVTWGERGSFGGV